MKNHHNFMPLVMPLVPIKKYILCLLCVFLANCTQQYEGPPLTKSPKTATSKPYTIDGQDYYPQAHYELTQEGLASHYGGPDGLHGSFTSTGERFNMYQLTAAHKTLPLPCVIHVKNLENGKSIVLTVNDRGPFVSDRILDVSVQAAQCLGFYEKGLARVRIKTLVRESLQLVQQKKLYARLRKYTAPLGIPLETRTSTGASCCAPAQKNYGSQKTFVCDPMTQENFPLPQTPAKTFFPAKPLKTYVLSASAVQKSPAYVTVCLFSLHDALSVENKARAYGKTNLRKEKNGLFRVIVGPFYQLANARNVQKKISGARIWLKK